MGKDQFAAVELLWDILNGKTKEVSKVTYFPQKPDMPQDAKINQPFPRATPESQGIPSERLSAMIEELSRYPWLDVHHVLVIRNGKMICECSFSPYRPNIWHSSYSLCKSITGLAIGMLYDKGKIHLDTPITEFFKDKDRSRMSFRQKKITVENLLTMTSGVDFHEAGAYTGDDWVKGYLGASVREMPGEIFDYNSMNSYMLSAIVTAVTGQSLMDFLTPRLWKPLGITNVFWETCPMGITKGGWGLFICPEDAAKIGQLILQGGIWKRRRIISEEWLKTAAEKHVEVPPESGLGYGYHMWMADRPGSSAFNGMLGQNVLIYPDINMVIVTNAGSNELFQRSTLIATIEKYLGAGFEPADPLPENESEYKKLLRIQSALSGEENDAFLQQLKGWSGKILRRSNKPNPARYVKKLDGMSYALQKKNIGIFPLLLQVVHNNFTEGIQTLSFHYQDEKFWISFLEGTEKIDLPVGFEEPARSTVKIHGEGYLVATGGEFAFNEDDILVLKLDIAFLEEAVRRKIKIYFLEDSIEMKWDEIPGARLILKGVQYILTDVSDNFLIHTVSHRINSDLVIEMLRNAIQPVILGLPAEQEEPQQEQP